MLCTIGSKLQILDCLAKALVTFAHKNTVHVRGHVFFHIHPRVAVALRRQMRSTRLALTVHPSERSIAVILR